MSQQDYVRSVRLNSDSLKVALRWLLDCCHWDEVKWRKDCTWGSPRLLVVVALIWSWSDEPTVGDRFTTARKIALHLFPQNRDVGSTYQGFMKLLRKWTDALIQPVMVSLRRRTQTTCRDYMQVAGFVLFAVDGSRAELPRTQAHECVFSCAKKRRKARLRAKSVKNSIRKRQTSTNMKKSEKPAMWMTTLWHVGSGLPWDWRLGPTDSSERAHWMEMLESVDQPAMFVGDAGFVGYEYAAAVLNAGHQLTIRVGSHVTLLKRLGYARETCDTVYLWPDKSAKRQGLAPLVFRLVVSHNGKHPIYLITSVVHKKSLCDQDVLAIYKCRWGIEVFYRHLKQTFNRRKLRSAAPSQAYVEMHWAQLGLWCMGLYAIKELLKSGNEPAQLSFAKLIRAFQRTLRDYLHPHTTEDCLLCLLKNSLKDAYTRNNKTSREYPQKKKEKPPEKPKLVTATLAQRKLAKQIKQEIGFTA